MDEERVVVSSLLTRIIGVGARLAHDRLDLVGIEAGDQRVESLGVGENSAIRVCGVGELDWVDRFR
jgi:hypothetical protein